MSDTALIEITGLRVTFHGDNGRITRAVDALDLSVGHFARSAWSANPVVARA